MIHIFLSQSPMKLLQRNNRGFTLIELMVAIFISALIFTIIVFGLKTMIQHYRALEMRERDFKQMQMGFWDLRQDFDNLIPRKVHDESNTLILPFMGNNIYVEFTTLRGSLIRRAYFYDASKQQLIERTFQVLDRMKPGQYSDKVLFHGIKILQFQYYAKSTSSSIEKSEVWPLNTTDSSEQTEKKPEENKNEPEKKEKKEEEKSYPDAVSITIDFASKGRITRIFLVNKNV